MADKAGSFRNTFSKLSDKKGETVDLIQAAVIRTI